MHICTFVYFIMINTANKYLKRRIMASSGLLKFKILITLQNRSMFMYINIHKYEFLLYRHSYYFRYTSKFNFISLIISLRTTI